MTIDLQQGIQLVLAIVAVVSLLCALSAWFTSRDARRKLEALESSLAQLEQAMQSAANFFAETDQRMSAASDQIDQLTVRQGTLAASASQVGFQQAIALSRRGASAGELMDVCGVSQGEARLIQTMYGDTGPQAAAN